MKHGSNPRRGRSRGNGKRHPASRSQNFESSGPDVKIRGSAQQVQEKYLNLARDAFSAGDRITAEGYYQYAEHYYRLANPYTGPSSASNAGPKTDSTAGHEADQGRNPRPPNAPPVREGEAAKAPVAEVATGAKAEVVADAPAAAVNVPIGVVGDAGAGDKPAAPKRRSRGRKPAKVDTSGDGGAGGDDGVAAAGDPEKKPIPAA